MTCYDQLYREVSKLICLTLGGFIERRLSKLKGDKYMNVIYNTCVAERNKRKYPVQNANTSANNNNRKGNSNNPAIQNIISLCNKSGGALKVNPSVDFDVSMASYIICYSPLHHDLFDGLFNEYEGNDFTHAIIRIKDEFRPTGSHPNVRIYEDDEEVLQSVLVGRTQLKFIHNMLMPKKKIWCDQSDPFIETVIQKRLTIERQIQEATRRDEQGVSAEKVLVLDSSQIKQIVSEIREQLRDRFAEVSIPETDRKEVRKETVCGSVQDKGKSAEDYLAEGVRYYRGDDGVLQDYKQAVNLFLKAAELGSVEACGWLGYCFYKGLGVPRDYRKAMDLFTVAAEENDSDSQYLIGLMHFNGEGVKKNVKEAVRWFAGAAYNGNPCANYWMGYCYYKGLVEETKTELDKEKNFHEAECFFKGIKDHQTFTKYEEDPLVRNGTRMSCEEVNANLYLGCLFIGPDPDKACDYLRVAAKEGNSEANFQLGCVYEEYYNYSDYAFEYFKVAADAGNKSASFYTGMGYHYGVDDKVEPNEEKAVSYLLDSIGADQISYYDYSSVYEEVGESCYLGRRVPRDYDKAVKLFKVAAEDKYRKNAQRYLGECYHLGRGVPQDDQLAAKWFEKAAETDRPGEKR